MLSGKGWGGIALGDGLVLVGTLFWASHVLAVGWLVQRVNPIALAVLQFLVCSFLSGIGALGKGNPELYYNKDVSHRWEVERLESLDNLQ